MIFVDPQDVADYAWDFAPVLDVAETLSSPTITITPTGALALAVGKPSPAVSGSKVIAWLAGGVLDARYDAVCHVTTSGGRQFDLTLEVWMQQR